MHSHNHPRAGGMRHRLILPALAALVLAAGAQAGTATIASSDGGSISFEYEGDLLRINTEEPGTYVLVLQNTMYLVNTEGDQPMVFNASSMMKGLASNAAQFAENDALTNFKSLEKTGRQETVAGIEGDVYLLTYTDDRGREQQQEAVLSKSKLARELRDAMFAMAFVASDLGSEEARQEGLEMRARLDDLDAGILRVGQDMRVTAISGEPIDASRFELPAEPMDMQGFGSMLGAAMSQQSDAEGDAAQNGNAQGGGLLGGMFGGFGKGQAGEDDDSASEDTEEGKKNPLKGLGKLFGKKDS